MVSHQDIGNLYKKELQFQIVFWTFCSELSAMTLRTPQFRPFVVVGHWRLAAIPAKSPGLAKLAPANINLTFTKKMHSANVPGTRHELHFE